MATAQAPGALPDAARALVLALVGVAALAGALLAAAAFRSAASPLQWAALATVALAAFAVQRRAFIVRWRELRIAITLDEPVLLLGFLLAAPVHVVLALVTGVFAAQLAARRTAIKVAYNVASYALAATAAAGAFLAAAALGAPPLAAIVVAAPVYVLASNALMSMLFGAIEGARPSRVFRERFALPTFINAGAGAALTVTAWALWLVHPVALLALAPFVALAVLFTRALTRLDRESRVRERLTVATRSLLTSPDEAQLAQNVLRECGELFLAGRAELALLGNADVPPRSWSAEFEGGADPFASPLEAPLVDREGAPLGTLRVYPARRAPAGRDARLDGPLLRLFAAEATAAIEMAAVVRRYASLHTIHDRIVRHAPAGIVRLDPAGRVVEHNEAFERAVGAPREAWATLLGDAGFAEGIARVVRGSPFQNVEVAIDGAVFDVAGVPLPSNDGETRPGSIVLFRDVSAHHQAAEAQRKHSVTRPLVRRIVLEIVREGAVPERLLVSLGRQLAKEVDARSASEFARAFREMGLGDLRAAESAGGLVAFTADDLLERRPRAKLPTCHLTRGYVEGVVETLEGHPALGSEVRCQSQGHADCQFYVKAKPELARPAKAASHVGFGRAP